jgi:hypothetical protein
VANSIVVLSCLVVIAGCTGTRSRAALQTQRIAAKGKVVTFSLRAGKPLSAADMVAQLTRGLEVPARPNARLAGAPWRPRRYTGPFTAGSELQDIQVLLNNNAAAWYYNGFFADHDSPAIYKRYYRMNWGAGSSFDSVELPGNATPDLTPRTADHPGADGANEILLSLQRIEYSSRYGGSVRLVFGMASHYTAPDSVQMEDFDYEFKTGDYLFDTRDLEMSIYVIPLVANLNPTHAPLFPTSTYAAWQHTEFSASAVTAYKLKNGKAEIAEYDAAAQAALMLVEGQVGSNLSPFLSYGPPNAQLFVLGWLHDQFQSLLTDGTTGVKAVHLSDNYADMVTYGRTPVFSLYLSLEDVGVTDSDYEMWGNNYNIYQDPSAAGSGQRVEVETYPRSNGIGWAYVVRPLEPGDSTPWMALGTWTVAECPGLVEDRFTFRLADPGFFGRTWYGPADFLYSFSCSALTDLVNAQSWGTADEVSTNWFLDEEDPSNPPLGEAYHAVIPLRGTARVILDTR